MAAIEILGLEKTYSVGFWRKRPKRALHPLHLAIEDGEIFGFLGPNGAGKTTTLKMLMGLVFPSGGSARILGMDLMIHACRRRSAFCPSSLTSTTISPRANSLPITGSFRASIRANCHEKSIQLWSRLACRMPTDVQLRKFSKGMLQRAGIAQAILHDPKVVFLDEPMSGLDPMGRREVRSLIEQLKAEGKTVFFSTHILSDAEALCDRVAVINLGQLRGVGAVAELTSGVRGKVEIVWQGTSVPAAIKSLGAETHVAGDTTRAIISEQNQDAAIEAVRCENLRLISVTPVRVSLEDYFMAQLKPSPEEVVAR